MVEWNFEKISEVVVGMYISHYNNRALPGAIASTFITPIRLYRNALSFFIQTDNRLPCVAVTFNNFCQMQNEDNPQTCCIRIVVG